MSVYVDRAKNAFGRMSMSHMIADTPDELHAMADRLRLKRSWYQTPPKASFWHYDIAQTKRAEAIAAGAVDCDMRTFVDHLRRIRDTLARHVFVLRMALETRGENMDELAKDRDRLRTLLAEAIWIAREYVGGGKHGPTTERPRARIDAIEKEGLT